MLRGRVNRIPRLSKLSRRLNHFPSLICYIGIIKSAGKTIPPRREVSIKAEFFDRALRHKLLSAEDQRDLAEKAKAGDSRARDQLVRHNLKLADRIARRYAAANPKLDLDDLRQAANLGLVESLDTFNPDKDTKFSTHAAYRMRALVIRFVVANRNLVRIKRGEQERILLRVSAVRAELVAAGETATSERIAEVLDADPALVAEILTRIGAGAESSLDKQIGDDEGSATGIDMLADPKAVSGESLTENQWRIAITDRIQQAIDEMGLSDRNWCIATCRLTLDPIDARTLGNLLGCSYQTVYNVEKLAKQVLQSELAELYEAI